MQRTRTQEISGWGRYPREICHMLRPEKYEDLQGYGQSSIARGQGRSYGDASLNREGTVVLTERLNRFLAFDKEKGILTCEAGVTLKEILEVIVPALWFLPVTPGTQFASLGGCVAADIHGKNHHHAGSLGQYVIALELMTAGREKVLCSLKDNTDLFWATVGGMGLTGLIGTVVLKLKPLSSCEMLVQHYTANNLEQTFHMLSDSNLDDEYVVAWIDTLAKSEKMGRSILMTAHHASQDEISPKYKRKISKPKNIFMDLPSWILNPSTIRLFNEHYFRQQSQKKDSFITSYQDYFYPLDSLTHWNRLYGKKGFVQYQCVFPEKTAFEGISQILQLQPLSFLSVIKKFGESGKGLLSFPMKGVTLAMDIPFRDEKTLSQLKQYDEIVVKYDGRVYLAKDACLSSDEFKKMYPQYPQWLKIKHQIDPNNHFSSSLSKRLEIGG